MATTKKLKYSAYGDVVKSTRQGTMSFRFKDGISVDVTLDGSIRVTNKTVNAVAAVNADSNSSAMLHPSGFMYRQDETVNVQVNDVLTDNNKLAKIRPTGIHFRTVRGPLVYLVDEAGVRTNFGATFEKFDRDVTLNVFYKGSRHGAMYADVCAELLSDIESRALETGNEWKLHDVVVTQEYVHGAVRVTKGHGDDLVEIRTSASTGTIGLYSNGVDCTASNSVQKHHFFVKKDKSRIHYEMANSFNVRFGAYQTGFNVKDEVVIH